MINWEVEPYVHQRIMEFEKIMKEGKTRFNFKPFLNLEIESDIVMEMAFCLVVPNDKAINGLKFQKILKPEDFTDIKTLKKNLSFQE